MGGISTARKVLNFGSMIQPTDNHIGQNEYVLSTKVGSREVKYWLRHFHTERSAFITGT